MAERCASSERQGQPYTGALFFPSSTRVVIQASSPSLRADIGRCNGLDDEFGRVVTLSWG